MSTHRGLRVSDARRYCNLMDPLSTRLALLDSAIASRSASFAPRVEAASAALESALARSPPLRRAAAAAAAFEADLGAAGAPASRAALLSLEAAGDTLETARGHMGLVRAQMGVVGDSVSVLSGAWRV